MITILIITSVLFAIFTTLFVIQTIKFSRLKKEYISEQRIGYYIKGYDYAPDETLPIEARVYVKETKKYTNGDSEIELFKIEIIACPSKVVNGLKFKIKDEFITTKPTTDIEWLITEESIRILRKKKLEAINKLRRRWN